MNHMLLQAKAKIVHIIFSCTILHSMLIEHDEWQDEDEDDDVAAIFREFSIDQRIIDLWRGPNDKIYVGSGSIDNCDVEVECKWTQLRH